MSKKTWLSAFVMLFLALVGLIVVFPFYSMFIMGTYSTNEIYRGIHLLPGTRLMENVRTLLSINFMKYYQNSIIVAVFGSSLSVFVSAMAGYALGMYEFKGKKTFFAVILLTLMIPGQLSLIGMFMEVKAMGLNDTLLILILLSIPNAFGVFWMSSFAKQAIPMSVIESAELDGCSDYRTFLSIGLPFMLPACSTLFLLAFLGSWNSFITPTLLLSKEKLYTIPLGIRQLRSNFGTDVGAQTAGLALATLPILVIFSVFSKTLIAGLSASAVKE